MRRADRSGERDRSFDKMTKNSLTEWHMWKIMHAMMNPTSFDAESFGIL